MLPRPTMVLISQYYKYKNMLYTQSQYNGICLLHLRKKNPTKTIQIISILEIMSDLWWETHIYILLPNTWCIFQKYLQSSKKMDVA